MKKLINWILHPIGCWKYTRDKEQMLLFCAACIHKEIKDPTIWEVDSLTEVINEFLAILFLNPKMFDETPIIKKGLFWTRMLSRFKHLTMSRDDTRKFIELYGVLKGLLTGKIPKTEPVEIYQAWKIMGDSFMFG